jgi:hypothetical protein
LIQHLDTYGRFRYLEIPNIAFGKSIVGFDRAVWELRRYCTTSHAPRQFMLSDGDPAPKVRLVGGLLEKIIDNKMNPARAPLLWQNAFFGARSRRQVKVRAWMEANNSPLSQHPEILDEVLKYVFLPKDIVTVYRARKPQSNLRTAKP